jgi:hypothetical protein
MDFSSISIAVSSLKTAKEIGQAALAFRDFNQTAGAITQINEQLLKAQDGLFAHNSQLMELQQKYFEATEELRKLKEALAERGRYSLFQLSPNVFVYRVNVSPDASGSGDPGATDPMHYLCQPCFDKGVKSVLQKQASFGIQTIDCSICGTKFRTGEEIPHPTLNFRT